jgi:hypothetical protein
MRSIPPAGVRWNGTMRRWRARWLILPLALVLGYVAWPYLTLWQLDRALAGDDRAALTHLIDLEAIRTDYRRRLNKDSGDVAPPPSDAFITWLEQAIRREGTVALEVEVTMDWLRGLLLAPATPGSDARPVHTHFAGPLRLVRCRDTPHGMPVCVRLGLTGRGWRVIAVDF